MEGRTNKRNLDAVDNFYYIGRKNKFTGFFIPDICSNYREHCAIPLLKIGEAMSTVAAIEET